MTAIDENIKTCLKKYWGFDSLRPLQGETIESVLGGQDSLTVMPTGGGKSLCFQLPALLMEGMAVVLSPTISLMKDQVDALQGMGIPAAFWNSSLTAIDVRNVTMKVRAGEVKLLYITPERLCLDEMTQFLKTIKVASFVIDEAHCISEWGHSFRADYRRLAIIKTLFPKVGVHAFTASATPDVQRDIVRQLGLVAPGLHTGGVDRPNLTYRIRPRTTLLPQLEGILSMHKKEPGIIYCAKRADVDKISAHLNERGWKNLPYHAGLSDEQRTVNQTRFATEEVDIMVATLAFGMGIDRSNIRFIVHAAMPKNMEQYYQETGRAGRDGLPASCYLLFGAADYRTGLFFIDQEGARDILKHKLDRMYGICLQPQCRHLVLSEYFGHTYENASCRACDYCLGELELVEEPLILGQKILSAVARCAKAGMGFGGGHIADVLIGKRTDKVIKFRHDELSVFNLLPDESAVFLRYMIEQLEGQGFLVRETEYGTLSVTERGRLLLKGGCTVTLAKPLTLTASKKVRREKQAPEGMGLLQEDKKLFEILRERRSELAREMNKPAYIIFSDKTLWDMAAKKPVSREEFLRVFGVGVEKQQAYADTFTTVIRDYLEQAETQIE